ncbi:MAG: ABC transporter permease, partial [Treponema sp.]|nr:ABC transporter permease [Treponema sp.]
MHWISFVARRYVSRGRKRSPQALFSVLGIATGALALVVILSVMNGFQLGFIESILEMSSGHLRVDAVPSDSAAALTARLASLSGVVSAAPFREASCLAKGSRAKQPRGVLVRGVPPDVLSRDPGLAARLLTRDGARLEEGAFDLAGPRNIVLGAELARYLDVAVGDAVQLLSISGRLGGALAGDGEEGESEDAPFIVAGVFRCGFYEYDLGWAYINIDSAAALQGGAVGESILIKLKNRWQDAAALERVKKGILEAGYSDGSAGGPRARSWRDYNRAVFSALRTEKLKMFI